ncbi:MAG: WGR domain-containing protein [Erysipelotrichia bacterium]|nr:WGR domain-containing protein [Erysipelotrichia bacterium]
MQHPTLFSVKKDHLLLTRFVKGRMRYYLLKIEETLFGEYLLEKVYGSMSHKKPTRVLKEYYDSLVEAKKMFDRVIKGKKKKGYHV